MATLLGSWIKRHDGPFQHVPGEASRISVWVRRMAEQCGPSENKVPVVVNLLHSSSFFLTAVGCLLARVSIRSSVDQETTNFFEVTAPRRCKLPFLLRTKATPATVTRFGVVLAVLGSSTTGKLVLDQGRQSRDLILDTRTSLLPPRAILNGTSSTRIWCPADGRAGVDTDAAPAGPCAYLSTFVCSRSARR